MEPDDLHVETDEGCVFYTFEPAPTTSNDRGVIQRRRDFLLNRITGTRIAVVNRLNLERVS